MVESMLTTTDNPFDPFDQFNEWLVYDTLHGHGTLNLLARLTISSPALSTADQLLAIDQAMDEIVEMNVNGLYKKVSREVVDAEADSNDTTRTSLSL